MSASRNSHTTMMNTSGIRAALDDVPVHSSLRVRSGPLAKPCVAISIRRGSCPLHGDRFLGARCTPTVRPLAGMLRSACIGLVRMVCYLNFAGLHNACRRRSAARTDTERSLSRQSLHEVKAAECRIGLSSGRAPTCRLNLGSPDRSAGHAWRFQTQCVWIRQRPPKRGRAPVP